MSAPGLAAVVVMGVSGCGKTTVARALAERLRWPFVEGDDLHPPANIAKMKAGQPLTDEDRAPWLAAIAARIDDWRRAGRAGVVTCSALKRAYRDRLRTGSLLPLREKEAPAREAGGRMRGRADLSASPNSSTSPDADIGSSVEPPARPLILPGFAWAPPSPARGEGKDSGASDVRFVHLHGAPEVLAARVARRRGHFMPPALLASQLATLEPPTPDEGAVTIDIDQPLAAQIAAALLGLGLDPTPKTKA